MIVSKRTYRVAPLIEIGVCNCSLIEGGTKLFMGRSRLGIVITMGNGKYPWSGILDGWFNLDHQEFAARWLGMLLRVCVWDISMANMCTVNHRGLRVMAPRQARRAARLMTIMSASKEASKRLGEQ